MRAEGDGISFEIHHINRMKNLKGKEQWEMAMIARKRKTLVVCRECHKKSIIRKSVNGKPCTSRGVSTVWGEACANRHWKQCTAALAYST